MIGIAQEPPSAPMLVSGNVHPRRSSSVAFFFFQAEAGIRGFHVTGVQTCALPISMTARVSPPRCSTSCSSRASPAKPAAGGSASRWHAGSWSSSMTAGWRSGRATTVRGRCLCWNFRWRNDFAATSPESRPAGGSRASRWSAARPRGGGVGEDPRPDGTYRAPDYDAPCSAAADLRRDVHEQGGGGNANAHRPVARGRSARALDRHVPLAVGPVAPPRSAVARFRTELHDLRLGRLRGAGEAPPRGPAALHQGVLTPVGARRDLERQEPHADARGARGGGQNGYPPDQGRGR